ncbi:hypothetical protein [Aureimonas leprariae]|uniref:Lipoprotein n=1 Tax=Plantimonas leprariae TaxID=2615207 RepID=A0A7V7PNS3_9HYPH|nr:hypothetical protein [Aureimonas leprariae]KAB0679375.1 hypothetical protein F6X38_13665 [Aureimonas leprariae]
MSPRTPLLAALLVLAGCAGMNEAVTVVPNTMDDLAAKTEGFRRGREPAPGGPRVEPPKLGL